MIFPLLTDLVFRRYRTLSPFLFKDDNQTIHVKSEGFISYYAVAEVETFDRAFKEWKENYLSLIHI